MEFVCHWKRYREKYSKASQNSSNIFTCVAGVVMPGVEEFHEELLARAWAAGEASCRPWGGPNMEYSLI